VPKLYEEKTPFYRVVRNPTVSRIIPAMVLQFEEWRVVLSDIALSIYIGNFEWKNVRTPRLQDYFSSTKDGLAISRKNMYTEFVKAPSEAGIDTFITNFFLVITSLDYRKLNFVIPAIDYQMKVYEFISIVIMLSIFNIAIFDRTTVAALIRAMGWLIYIQAKPNTTGVIPDFYNSITF